MPDCPLSPGGLVPFVFRGPTFRNPMKRVRSVSTRWFLFSMAISMAGGSPGIVSSGVFPPPRFFIDDLAAFDLDPGKPPLCLLKRCEMLHFSYRLLMPKLPSAPAKRSSCQHRTDDGQDSPPSCWFFPTLLRFPLPLPAGSSPHYLRLSLFVTKTLEHFFYHCLG